jgi:hypothetical protein
MRNAGEAATVAACELERFAWAWIAATATRPAMSVRREPLLHAGELVADLALVASAERRSIRVIESGTWIV